MGSVDKMIEGRFLIRMKKRGGGYKRSQCLLSSLMVMAAAVGLRLIKSLPLVEAEFQKCCQVNAQRRISEALHNEQQMQLYCI